MSADLAAYFVIGASSRKRASRLESLVATGKLAVPTIIVKRRSTIAYSEERTRGNRGRIFVAAIKSTLHLEPYKLAQQLMKPSDQLVILHIYKRVSYHLPQSKTLNEPYYQWQR
jgi:hypothetical protein